MFFISLIIILDNIITFIIIFVFIYICSCIIIIISTSSRTSSRRLINVIINNIIIIVIVVVVVIVISSSISSSPSLELINKLSSLKPWNLLCLSPHRPEAVRLKDFTTHQTLRLKGNDSLRVGGIEPRLFPWTTYTCGC